MSSSSKRAGPPTRSGFSTRALTCRASPRKIARSPRNTSPSLKSATAKTPNGLSKRTDAGLASRFRRFHISEIKERGYKLDVTWLKDDSLEDADELPEPRDLATEAVTELEAVVDDLREIVALVEKEEGVEK